jgi:hypothetical protein
MDPSTNRTMAAVHRTIYTLVYNGVHYGQVDTVDALQRLYDHLSEFIVQEIRTKGSSKIIGTNVDIDTKYVDVNGVFIKPLVPNKVALSDLINNHEDFFKYLSVYKRDLYTDRKKDRELATRLLDAIKEREKLQKTLLHLQRSWLEAQLEMGGGGVCIKKYPVWDENTELSVLEKSIVDMLDSIKD